MDEEIIMFNIFRSFVEVIGILRKTIVEGFSLILWKDNISGHHLKKKIFFSY